MKSLPLFLLLFVCSIYSQSTLNLDSQDTIFVHFKRNKLQSKTVFPIDSFGVQKRWYTITLGNSYEKKFIRFYFQEYTSPEKRDKKIKSDVRTENKLFLKKHKKQIVGIDFFKNHDVCTLREIFYNKVVYIIDFNERKKGKLILYETTPSFSCDAIE